MSQGMQKTYKELYHPHRSIFHYILQNYDGVGVPPESSSNPLLNPDFGPPESDRGRLILLDASLTPSMILPQLEKFESLEAFKFSKFFKSSADACQFRNQVIDR